jgi:hypothetical protein
MYTLIQLLHRKFIGFWIPFLLTAILILNIIVPTAEAEKTDTLLYEERYSEHVSKGVDYERIIKYTTGGWLTIHLLTVDISDRNIEINTLLPEKGLSFPEPISKMALREGAVSAINGDFFNMGNDTYTIGPVIKSGELISSPTYRNDMAVFSITRDKVPFIEKWLWKGNLVFPDGTRASINAVNKSAGNAESILMYTRYWSEHSPGCTNKTEYVEVVVEGNKVVEIREGLPPAAIPENGYVLAACGMRSTLLKDKLKPGDTLEVELSTLPDWREIYAAVGGGGILIKDGKIPDFEHNITGRHPRTAIGISRDQETMFLVVVEGRHPLSTGMDQKELAEFLLSVGAYNALNLDGGGSSVMAVRPLGENEVTPISTIANGFERRVPNGIGIFYTGKTDKLKGLKIKAPVSKIPLGGTLEFEVLGYDRNYNPVAVDPKKVTWSVSNNLGKFKGSTFHAQKSGRGYITARIGRIKEELPIHVLEEGIRIELHPSRITLEPGQARDITAYIEDTEGYRAVLNPADVEWEVMGDIGTVEDGRFTASSSSPSATGAVIARYENLSAVCLISIGKTERLIEDFQDITGMKALAYPQDVGANFEISPSPELLFSQKVGKLEYNFSGSSSPQASYAVFEGGRELPEGTKKLGLWVFGNGGNNHWLRALVTDSSGKDAYITLARNVNWCGWRKVEGEIPDDLIQPIKLRRIYLAETEMDKMDSGAIYFEGLTVFSPPDFDYSFLSMVSEKEYFDPKNTEVELKTNKKSKGFQFILFGDALIARDYNPVYYEHLSAVVDVSRKSSIDFILFSGNFTSNSEITPWEASRTWLSISPKPVYPVGDQPYSQQKGKNRFIFLDSSRGGLRPTNPEQWIFLQKELRDAGGDNIFIITNLSPENFSDKYEKQLLEDILTKYREEHDAEVWFFYGNVDEPEIYRRNGVYYAGVPGVSKDAPQYILFTVKDNKVTYQIESITP